MWEVGRESGQHALLCIVRGWLAKFFIVRLLTASLIIALVLNKTRVIPIVLLLVADTR